MSGKLFLDPPRFGEEAGRERDITIYRAIYRVGQWSELGGRDIDGQTREGEQSG